MDRFSSSQAYVALAIAYWRNEDVIEWAVQELKHHPDPEPAEELQEIAWLNTKRKQDVGRASRILEALISNSETEFAFSSYETEAKAMLAKRIREYLRGECLPYGLCQMVSPIEQCFDFPTWLGELYNACDWCEPDSQPCHFSHLEEMAKDVLNAL